jgi:signal peptidase I
MLLTVIAIAILILVGLIYLFLRRYTIIRINGDSMLPTLKHGQFRFLDRKFFRENLCKFSDPMRDFDFVGRIYVYQAPTGTIVIKRLTYISSNSLGYDFWFEGDNPPHSEDSRNYGFVREGDIYGEVISDFKTFWKRLFIL